MNTSLNRVYNAQLSEQVIVPFRQIRLNILNELSLVNILKDKNPYLLNVRNIRVVEDLARSLIDAHLSAQEEEAFGMLLKDFAVSIVKTLYKGSRSELKGLDLEFERDGVYYIVAVNARRSRVESDQISTIQDHFKTAKATLRERGIRSKIVAVNGCTYGEGQEPLKTQADPQKQFYQYAGQEFWRFISNDGELHHKIIALIYQDAERKDELFSMAYNAKINEMVQQLTANFMTHDNQVDWLKLIDFVSQREQGRPTFKRLPR